MNEQDEDRPAKGEPRTHPSPQEFSDEDVELTIKSTNEKIQNLLNSMTFKTAGNRTEDDGYNRYDRTNPGYQRDYDKSKEP